MQAMHVQMHAHSQPPWAHKIGVPSMLACGCVRARGVESAVCAHVKLCVRVCALISACGWVHAPASLDGQ